MINQGYFCARSSAPLFLAWLHEFAPDIHIKLIEYIRQGHGCRANTQKMLWVFDEIIKKQSGKESLNTFLRNTFPHVLNNKSITPAPNLAAFEHFYQTLLTIPRRSIFASEIDALRFLADKPVGEYVTIGDKTYVEYLSQDLANLASSIPMENWLIRQFKKSNGLTKNIENNK